MGSHTPEEEVSSSSRPKIVLQTVERPAIRWGRAVGLLFGGIGVFLIGVTGYRLTHLAEDASLEENCRNELNSQALAYQGLINIKGWEALRAEVLGAATDEQTLAAAREMERLAVSWEKANEDRLNAEEICS